MKYAKKTCAAVLLAYMLLVSHSAQQIERLYTRALWLKQGKMMQIGPAAEVCRAYAEVQG